MAALKFKVSGDTSQLNSSLTKSKGMLGGLAKAGAKIGVGLAAGFAAGGAAAGVLGAKMIAVGEAASTANARILSVATSMGLFGNQAGSVAERLQKVAAATELNTGVDRNQIKMTQAKLLTFAELGKTADQVGGNFDRATAAAVDMASAGFGTAEQNAVQLGKALNDPIKGISALRRSGITFTEAEKKKIQTLVESNRMLEAQGLVLGAIEKQVGGAAAATANSSDKIKAAFSQGFEALAVPFSNLLDSVAPKMIAFLEGMKPKLEALGQRAVAFGRMLSAAFSTGAIPGMLQDGLILAGKSFVNFLVGGIRGILAGAWEWMKNMPKVLLEGFKALADPSLWKGLGNILAGLGKQLGLAILTMLPQKLLDLIGVDQSVISGSQQEVKDQLNEGVKQMAGALDGYAQAQLDGAKNFAEAFAREMAGTKIFDTTEEKESIAKAMEKIRQTAEANRIAAEAAKKAPQGLGAPAEPEEEAVGKGKLGALKPILSSLASVGGAAGLLGLGKNLDRERNSLLKSIERNTARGATGGGVAVYA